MIGGDDCFIHHLQVLDILRSNELFAPHVVDMKGRIEDPVTTDLVGALLLVYLCLYRHCTFVFICIHIYNKPDNIIISMVLFYVNK